LNAEIPVKNILFSIAVCFTLTVNGQSYLISFAGSGASAIVGTVKVENLTAGTFLDLNGNDILHLKGTVGIYSVENAGSMGLKIYPNPMNTTQHWRSIHLFREMQLYLFMIYRENKYSKIKGILKMANRNSVSQVWIKVFI